MELINRIARKIVADEENRAKRSKYRDYFILRIVGGNKKNKYSGTYAKLFKVLNADSVLHDVYWEEDHWFEGDDMIVVISDTDNEPIELDSELESKVLRIKNVELVE